MIKKKLIILLFFYSYLGACTSPTAMLGPVYTLSTTGNTLQAGLSYSSSEIITKYTGKTPIENIIEFKSPNQKNNIKRKTLESEDFYILVKNKIDKKSGIFKISNQ